VSNRMKEGIKRLHDYRRRTLLGGGKEQVEKHHGKGKLTARERLELLLDPDSFVEFNAFAESQCRDFGMEKKKVLGDGILIGHGKIDGRTVCVFSQDATVLGGSIGTEHGIKMSTILNLAIRMGVPFVGLNDSAGARLQEAISAGGGVAGVFLPNTLASGRIPQLSAIMGTCAGIAVYSPAITDFVFMVDKTSHMFITGPTAIKTVTGEDVTFEELGGARVHSQMTGNADFRCKSEEECFKGIRKLIGYLPSNNQERPPGVNMGDDPLRRVDELVDKVPAESNKTYDMHLVIEAIADNGEFMEVKAEFARNLLVGFARMDGNPVGIVANQPIVFGGSLTVDASDKYARFVRFCDAFNIPLIFLVDIPGYLPGKVQEHTGIIRHGAKALYAFCEATVPKITVMLRKAYGGGLLSMGCNKALGTDLVIAWPLAEIAAMGAEGAVDVLYKKEIRESKDPDAFRRKKIREYNRKYANPYFVAGNQRVDMVIEPGETRIELIKALHFFSTKEGRPYPKKHGNIPL
jgi:acetyl-CoA carboxylase carboxyltransferase component